MFTTYQKLFLALIGFICFASCDRVENPVAANSASYKTSLYPGNYVDDYPYPNFSASTDPDRVVILEDYTGHKCGNCPAAADEAKSIEDNNPNRVVVVSIHAGQGGVSSFQKWNKEGEGGYPKYSTNFTTESGLDYAIEIDGGCPVNPIGMVSRLSNGASNSLWLSFSTWQQATEDLLQQNEVSVDLQLEVNYYPGTKGLFVHTFAQTMDEIQSPHSVVLMLIDKKIVDWQKDYTLVDPDIPDYEHHNVHLVNINGTYGQEVFEANTAADETKQNDLTYKIPEKYIDDDLAVVAFIQNDDTYEITQVDIADVTP